ncbi:MAG: glutamate racemase [Eubacteriales bacterium]|nr:glutamate racemase [Eubacteriales bacterium]
MSDCCKPIGFFDSGVGGISVLKTAYQLMPCENYIYYGDSKNAPYGEKTEQEIKELSLAAGRFLFGKGVKAIVMACNTATSAAVLMMREKYNIPVISMEPAVKPALEAAKGGRVIVLATPATVTQARYLGLLERLGAGNRVINIGCGGLVELIENGQTDEITVHGYLERKLTFVKDTQIDSVVIGCTHYSFVENEIKSYIDKAYHTDCKVFDGRHGTVKHLRDMLDSLDMRCHQTNAGRIEYHTSGQATDVGTFLKLFDDFDV